jgi:chemotaxis protein histidine kinase CheA
MASIKQLISNAVHQLYNLNRRYDDADLFCRDLFKLLDNEVVEPGNGEPEGYVEPPAEAPAPAAPTPAPAPKPKLTKEEKAAEKAAKEAAKAEKERIKAEKEKAKAEKEAAKAKPKEPKEVKPKPTANMTKLNPTQVKLFKKAAGAAEETLKQIFVDSMNALTPEEFDAKKMEDHMADFIKNLPKEEVAPEAPVTVNENCVGVEYKGKEYYVSSNGTVYEETTMPSGETVDKKVGMVGMAYFKDLKIPEPEPEDE